MRYSRLPAFVLGFHGCDRATAERVVGGGSHLKPSRNDYDWLGHGIYFWENDPVRAARWAREKSERARERGKAFEPTVVGAVIDLGDCLNLLDAASNQLLVTGYRMLKAAQSKLGLPMPENQDRAGDSDKLFRRLDCAVINALHNLISEQGSASFESVRAAFIEGRPVYPASSFRKKNHVQICVRNRRNIKGYFHVLPDRK